MVRSWFGVQASAYWFGAQALAFCLESRCYQRTHSPTGAEKGTHLESKEHRWNDVRPLCPNLLKEHCVRICIIRSRQRGCRCRTWRRPDWGESLASITSAVAKMKTVERSRCLWVGLGLLCVGALVGGAVLILLEPRMELARRRRINAQMQSLADRAKANPSDSDAVYSLVKALHSGDFFEKKSAAACLGQLGPNAVPAVPDLIEAAGGSDPYLARTAVLTLGEVGPDAGLAVPTLLRVMSDRQGEDIGCFAAESLGRIADPSDSEVKAALEDATKSRISQMRIFATRALRILDERHGGIRGQD